MTRGKMKTLFLLICLTGVVLAADVKEKKTEETREKRNLNAANYQQGPQRREYNPRGAGYAGPIPNSPGNKRVPPNAVHMEPLFINSERDPLQSPIPIISAVYDSNAYPYSTGGHAPSQHNYRPHPQPQPQYLEAPEPIIEIIIQDSNETLPSAAPIVQHIPKKKKEQVQVFYVKYHKDEKNGLIIHDPIPALTPNKYKQHEEEDSYEEHVQIVTPSPPVKTTTLRAIIRPESEQYEAKQGVHVTFGSAHNHHSKADYNIQEEKKAESAIQPVVAVPQNRVDLTAQFKQNQGRIINTFNPNVQNQQNNFVNPPPFLSSQLSLPHQQPAKPFNPNFQQPQQQPIRPSQPAPQPLPPQQQQQQPVQHFNNRPQFIQNSQFPTRFGPQAQPLIGGPPPQQQPPQQQQQIPNLRPPLLNAPQSFNTNFNAPQQRPFNHHAHQSRVPSQQPLQQQQQLQNFQQLNQRPQRPIAPAPVQSSQFNQQLPLNRPPTNFNTPFATSQNRPSFPIQQLPKQQPQVPQFRPMPPQQQVQQQQQLPPRFQTIQQKPIPQFNHQPHQQHHVQQFNDQNVFRGGGLVEQTAPNLVTARPHVQQQQQQQHINHAQNIQSVPGLIPQGGEIQNSEVRYEQHITETISSPILYETHSINMDLSKPGEKKDQHRFSVNQQQQQQHQGGVSNLFSDVFTQQSQPGSFLNVDPRNNYKSSSPSPASPTTVAPPPRQSSIRYSPTPTTTTSTTQRPFQVPSNIALPDEVPDDLRQHLIDSGILENAHISVLDYDKIGETSLDQLPPEHLANFFSAGGGSQIASSNKIVSVVKPNGESIEQKIKSIKSDPEISKILENTKKLPAKKEDVNLKVVRFDADSEKQISNQYIKQDSTVLPSVNINQNYNRYLPLKINGAKFPIPDAEELRGKRISSVVVLAPVDNSLNQNGNSDESRVERDLIDTKQIQFVAGEVLKQLIKKPSSENYKKWLEKESKIESDQQSVILLVTKNNDDDDDDQQEIFMYDIATKAVNKLDGELSTKFVNVAEENSEAQDEDLTTVSSETIDRSDQVENDKKSDEESDSAVGDTNIVETVVKFDEKPRPEEENKVLISSGYSVIKNE